VRTKQKPRCFRTGVESFLSGARVCQTKDAVKRHWAVAVRMIVTAVVLRSPAFPVASPNLALGSQDGDTK
jgi:hypothetical protein